MDRRVFLKISGALGIGGLSWTGLLLPGKDPFVHAAQRLSSAEAGYTLPSWFEKYRVHAHTRLPLRFLGKDVFFKASAGFRQMGVHVFTRHLKSRDEGAWWPGALGAVAPEARGRNLAKEIIEGAHREGLSIIAYYNHSTDQHMARVHPDWVCKKWNGKPFKSKRGEFLCYNSPFPEYFLSRAMELLELGADGLYFDEVHMPKTGCWCQYCRTRFKRETGHDHPRRPDPGDRVYNELIDFNNRTIERTFLQWREGLHSRRPNVVMVVSANTWPAFVDRHLTNRLFRMADCVKTEFSLPAKDFPRQNIFPLSGDMEPFEKDVKMALGYTMVRDAADGRPGHVWIFRLRDEISALYAVAGVVTHGCIANIDVLEDSIPNPAYKKAFALGDQVSPHFSGTLPLRWAAVHFPELARDRNADRPAQAMRKTLYPFYGAYRVLLRRRLPVGIVTDSQLEDGLPVDCKVLFLPDPTGLTDAMSKSVANFKAKGNLVIENKESWHWHDKAGAERAGSALLESLGPLLSKAPVQVAGGHERMHVVSFVNTLKGQLTIAICNDFSWVRTGGNPSGREDLIDISEGGAIPASCRNVKITLSGGKPPGRVFEAISGKALNIQSIDGGVTLSVPDFEYMAVVVVDGGK